MSRSADKRGALVQHHKQNKCAKIAHSLDGYVMSTHNHKPMIYTIGYGNRSPEAFVKLLKRYQITCLFDVRSYPFSQHQPWFSRDRLGELLRADAIQYVWMGHLLGDKPNEMNFYTRGRLDYMKYRASSEFKQGLLQLQSAWNARVRFALMSQTLRPQVCHRARLIAEALSERGIDVAHVDEAGCLLPHKHIQTNVAALRADMPPFNTARPN
jgi:uncharacterized protein (DUF488 family)